MNQYQKMTNEEVLKLQTVLGSYRSHFGPKSSELSLLIGSLIFGLPTAFEKPWIFITLGLILLAIGLPLYRYLVHDPAKKKAMRKDLIHLEKEVLEVTLQYKTIDEKANRYHLHVTGAMRGIPVDRQTYDAVQPGERLRLSRSRYAQVVVGHEKLP